MFHSFPHVNKFFSVSRSNLEIYSRRVSFVQDRSLNYVQLKNGVSGKKACPRAANQLSFYVIGLGLVTERDTTYSKYFYQFSPVNSVYQIPFTAVVVHSQLTLSTKLTFSQSGKSLKLIIRVNRLPGAP